MALGTAVVGFRPVLSQNKQSTNMRGKRAKGKRGEKGQRRKGGEKGQVSTLDI